MGQPALFEALLIARVLLVTLAILTVSLVLLGAFRRQVLVGRRNRTRPTSSFDEEKQRFVARQRVRPRVARANFD